MSKQWSKERLPSKILQSAITAELRAKDKLYSCMYNVHIFFSTLFIEKIKFEPGGLTIYFMVIILPKVFVFDKGACVCVCVMPKSFTLYIRAYIHAALSFELEVCFER